MRPDRAGRHLCSRLSSDSRSPALRNHAASAEDPSRRDDRPVRMPAPVIRAREGFVDAYRAAIGSAFVASRDHVDELTVTVTREGLVEACRIARDKFGYQQLMEIAGVDYPERPERFEVNYHLLSVTENHRIRIK